MLIVTVVVITHKLRDAEVCPLTPGVGALKRRKGDCWGLLAVTPAVQDGVHYVQALW